MGVKRVLEAGYLGMSSEVKALEEELAEFIGSGRHVVCVNTGTSALQLSIQACGIGAGDEVLVPTLTYVASFQAVSATGAIPIPCDVDPRTGFLDVEDAKRRVTSNTKAIMPVHYASGFGALDAVYELAKDHQLRVIEDAAHSFGGTYKDKPVGAIGDIVCFSFDGIKNITCGEGGAIVTSDSVVANRIKDARLLGVERDTEKRYAKQRSWDFDVTEQGWRYHMNDLMAAIGREQLKKLPEFVEKRRHIVQRYKDFFEGHSVVGVLDINSPGTVQHICPIVLKSGDRDGLRHYLLDNNIETGLHYKPNHLLTKYSRGYSLLQAESLFEKLLTLPIHPLLEDADIDRITDRIQKWVDGNA